MGKHGRLRFKSYIRGYHVYVYGWDAAIGQQLLLKSEPNNPHDHAVSVILDDQIVYNLASVVSAFLNRPCHYCFATVTGQKVNRGASHGLEIPVNIGFLDLKFMLK